MLGLSYHVFRTDDHVQSFMHRLKFQYLESNAKDKYVKTIVNDEAPMITAEVNTALQATNVVKKENLKAAKSRLAQRHQDIRDLAPHVEKSKVLDPSRACVAKLRGCRFSQSQGACG